MPIPGHRGHSNTNERGSSYDRKRRREWLIEQFGIPRLTDGKKTRVKCHHCPKIMKADGKTWQVDRFPLCGHLGGKYVRDNIVVACPTCNAGRCRSSHAECRQGPRRRRPRESYYADAVIIVPVEEEVPF